MKITRHFTRENNDPFADIKFVEHDCLIKDLRTQKIIFQSKFTAPSTYSLSATTIIASKYARRAGVPDKTVTIPENQVPEWLQKRKAAPDATLGRETDMRDLVNRLAGTWTYWGWTLNYFDSEKDARAFYDECRYILIHQRAVPNSPQWFNTGLNWAYGIEGPAQGHEYSIDIHNFKNLKEWQRDKLLNQIFASIAHLNKLDPKDKNDQIAIKTMAHAAIAKAEKGDGVVTLPSTSAYERPQPHACFIQSVSDDLVNEGGIMDLWMREARLFKYGSGTGTNFSSLRSANEKLSGGGSSSGVMSFLRIGDTAAGAIKSGGTTRRAAKMVILNADHPDIEQFVDWKSREEHKVAMLVTGHTETRKYITSIVEAAKTDPRVNTNKKLRKACRDAIAAGIPQSYIGRFIRQVEQGVYTIDIPEITIDWEGEAYATVNGQNANNSIRVSDDFMRNASKPTDWNLIRRTDKSVFKTIKTNALWDKINLAAWASADPGLQFDTTINDWNTCPVSGRVNGSNPCSEYLFLDDTACNLASINLLTYLDDQRKFDVEGYRATCSIYMTVLDISVSMAQYPYRLVAHESLKYRTTGLGYANLGGLLMAMGYPYDSDSGRGVAADLTAIMTGQCYLTSITLAKRLGSFPAYDANANDMKRVIRNHAAIANRIANREGYEEISITPYVTQAPKEFPELTRNAEAVWNQITDLQSKGGFSGYRNAFTTVIAPTGTIGLAMDCDTTGVEPDFSLVKYKTLAGGGSMKIVNRLVPAALRNIGYTESQITEIVEHISGHGDPKHPDLIKDLKSIDANDENTIAETIKELGTVYNATGATKVLNTTGLMTYDTAQHHAYRLFGVGTIENAPHISPNHIPIFDCANKTADAKRFIAPMGHILMLAAVQPFLSGAASKTVNLPAEATIKDVANAHQAAWENGVKCVAIYRDNSKLSQPLNLGISADEMGIDDDPIAPTPHLVDPNTIDLHQFVVERGQLLRGQQKKLPAKRTGYTQKMNVGGHRVYLRTGEYPNGQLGEIFIDMHKEGAAFRALMNAFAMSTSIGLQYGVPLEEYIEGFTFTRFDPSGPVQNHGRIKTSTSILDLIFRDLAINYLGREDLAHVKANIEPVHSSLGRPRDETLYVARPRHEIDSSLDKGLHVIRTMMDANQQREHNPHEAENRSIRAQSEGFTGDSCDSCGSMRVVRNGTCTKCTDCGSTSGCS